MIFNNEEDDDRTDYFYGPDVPEKEKPEKKPEYKPDDPKYWEEEDRWEHLRPRRPFKLYLTLIAIVMVVAGAVVLWWYFFNPYVEEASQYGYVDQIEKRGVVFKTFEASIIPYKNIMDTTRTYDGDFIFSVPDDNIGAKLKQYQYSGVPVRVEYEIYHSSLPWRGDSQIIVINVDSIDPKVILPPDRNPLYNN